MKSTKKENSRVKKKIIIALVSKMSAAILQLVLLTKIFRLLPLVANFYKAYLVGRMPDDTKLERVSRMIGKDQVIDEIILKFTHDRQIDFMLPGIPPTGKYVELPHVVVMKFNGNKIAHEHIYWDQASLLAQVGILDANKLPIVGLEQSRRLQKLTAKNI